MKYVIVLTGIASLIGNLVLNKFLAVFSGPVIYGMFSYSKAFVVFFGGLACLFANVNISRSYSKMYDCGSDFNCSRSAIKVILIFGIIYILAGMLVYNSGPEFLQFNNSAIYILILAAISFSIVNYLQSANIGDGQVINNYLSNIFATFCVVILYFTMSLLSIKIDGVSLCLIYYSMLLLSLRPVKRLRLTKLNEISDVGLYKYCKISIPLLITGAVSMLLPLSQRQIILSRLGAESVGYFDCGMTLGLLLYNTAIYVASPVLTNAFLNNSDKEYRLLKYIKISIYFGLLMLFVNTIFSDYLIDILYTDKFSPSHNILILFTLYAFFRTIGFVISVYLQCSLRFKFFMFAELLSASVIYVGIILVDILNFSLDNYCLPYIFGALVYIIVSLPYVLKVMVGKSDLSFIPMIIGSAIIATSFSTLVLSSQ